MTRAAPGKMHSILSVLVGSVLRIAASYRSIHDHNDTGVCTGEFRSGNSEWTPYHYSISLELQPNTDTFIGNVSIWGKLNSSYSNTIDLHSVDLNVTKVDVDGIQLRKKKWYVDSTEGLLRIIMPKATTDAILRISYVGKFNETRGVIKQIYNETDNNRWIIFTYLEPAFARTVFPCIDLPKYKATFDISIKNPGPGRVVLSNMPQKYGDSNVIKFDTTPRMSTYLVAFVVFDYLPVRWTGESRNITTWVPKEMAAKNETIWVTQLTSGFLNALENYTGNAYSLPKLDQFVVKDKPGIGGMENWGLIMYQMDSFIPTDPTAASLFTVIYTIAHELSHHWFGNSVTTADWCGMWFQEAIPTFFHGLIPLQKMKDTDMVNKIKWMARKEVMDGECFIYDQLVPLRDEEDPKSSEGDLFSLSRYLKGASVITMIESLVKPSTFQTALQSFVKKYYDFNLSHVMYQVDSETDPIDRMKWLATTKVMDGECFFYDESDPLRLQGVPEPGRADGVFSVTRNYSFANEFDLWEEVTAKAGKDKFVSPSFHEVLQTWVTMRGHPIVFLQRHQNGTLFAGQRACLPRYTLISDWWIPITYTTNGSRPDFTDTSLKGWIAPLEENKELGITLGKDEWIVINTLGSGYYRVEYDPITWRLLVDQLMRHHEVIPPINRALLIDDSFHAANTGEKLVRAFEMMGYLPKEENALVWEAVLVNVRWQYKEAPSKEKVKLKNYLRDLLKHVFARVVNKANMSAWKKPVSSRAENLYQRSLMESVFELSCMMELKDCSRFSTEIAMELMEGTMNETTVPPEIRNKLWCAAVAKGPENVFFHVKAALKWEKDVKMRAQLFEQLKCSTTHTGTLLSLLLEIHAGESKETLRDSMKAFLIQNWPGTNESCRTILEFFVKNKLKLVDDESQLSMEFIDYVRNPPELCKTQVGIIFKLSSNDEKEENSWEQTFGTEPLKWLTNYFEQRKKEPKTK